jgi:hypothetical protein
MNRRLPISLVICLAMFIPVGTNLATAQTEAVIHSFQSSGKSDGSKPFGGVVADGTGSLDRTNTLFLRRL